MLASQPVWELRHVSKAFPGVQALSDVSFAILPGEIHALIGENGSGKSTLVKLLAGVHRPDAGDILFRGERVSLPDPTSARLHGVATIYQEFSLVPTLSVAENVFIGRLPKGLGRFVDWSTMRRQTVDVLKRLGIDTDPDATVGSLSVAEQQLVEIAKAISSDSNLLIMDEPTTALALSETRRLHDLIRRLAGRGRAILYITHRLNEIIGLADRVTVLKDGRLVGTRAGSNLNLNAVVEMMIGRQVDDQYPKERNRTPEPVLEVNDLRTPTGVNGVSFTVHRGEVFGLGGMIGSGRTEIGRALFGADRISSGSLRLNGKSVRFASPQAAIRAGLALIPENRKSEGLFFNFSGVPNITVSRLRALLQGPFLSLRREQAAGGEYLGRLRITRTAAWRSVRQLSGGNQQKVIIARWLFSGAKLLILDEPTQGIDIGAKLEVYRLINELTARGLGVLLISSDYRELLAMSDRIAVVREGRILRVAGASELTEYSLIEAASGVSA
jgi:ribose transport system ATP-binding protein